MKTTFASVAALICASPALAQTPTLNVYTYDSFTSEWGPGPAIEQAFEAECGCDLVFTGAGDGAALLARLQLEGARTDADVVLGLDTNLTAAAAATGLFAPHGVTADFALPITWDDDTFLPFDWGYLAFVAQADTPSVASFQELADSDLSIVVQDPRSSTPGLGLLMWVQAVHGDQAGAIWEGLSDNIVTVTPGWTEAYNLFLEGEADAVLSYTTSPAYHLIAEEDATKTSWAFDGGNYLQVEVAAKVAGTDQSALADQFMAFIATPAFQEVIPTTNWMYPATDVALPDGFETLTLPETGLLLSSQDAAAIRDTALETWRNALSQ
ncbi:thiamine transport system substrate-binding protein [Loktanella sp. DSM 29012]|uniref:thiamine ABC transporter substrate binding subunit n=1 Tax=Loktanella sp. DSM 29012 TaxID=1881056 RepID=UPI0008C7E3E9|nr:thiamine ABC transporter substrate binding subunit [Loktanella sp. DSM 29012]SEP68273.1 thiamine transport system substrate-binding protein [Loktanella sp. DSM 29012]